MALELLDLRHGRILPQNQLVLAETMTRTYLPLVLRPKEGAHLTSGIDRIQDRARICIPKLNGAIGGASAAGEQPPVERAPGQCLHRGPVVRQGKAGTDVRRVEGRATASPTGHGRVPEAEEILVPAAREGAALVVPPEAAHLLGVPDVRAHRVIATADVVLHDERVSTAGAQPVLVPAQSADPRRVPVERPQPPLGLGVPQLHDVVIRPHGDEVAVPLVADPAHARHEVGLLPQREQVLDVPRVGLPEVHALSERDREDVALAPAHEVEVVVVHELRRVQYPRRGLGYAPTDRLRRVAQTVLRLGDRVERCDAARGIVGAGVRRRPVEDVELIVGEGIDNGGAGVAAGAMAAIAVAGGRNPTSVMRRRERGQRSRRRGKRRGLSRQLTPSGRGRRRRHAASVPGGRHAPVVVGRVVVARVRADRPIRRGRGGQRRGRRHRVFLPPRSPER